LLIGAALGAAVNRHYAKQSSDQLKNEASRLRSRISELAHLMHDAGLIDAPLNDEGDLVKVV
jgi:hypothetical protein